MFLDCGKKLERKPHMNWEIMQTTALKITEMALTHILNFNVLYNKNLI